MVSSILLIIKKTKIVTFIYSSDVMCILGAIILLSGFFIKIGETKK